MLILVCCAVFYYRVAESENRSGLLWALFSIALYFGSGMFMPWGLGGSLLVQTIPFILMTALSMRSDR